MRFREQFLQIDPQTVKVERGFNARDFTLAENQAHLETLKTSIRTCGVQQPVWVRQDGADGSYFLVDGETRLRAVKDLIKEGVEIKLIPAKIVEGGNEIERKLLSLTANTGKPLSKWEAGTAYRQLEGWGHSHAQIGERVGQTERYVREAIELSNVPQDVKALLSSGKITTRLALKTTREHGSKSAEKLEKAVKQAEAEGKVTAKAPRQTKESDLLKVIHAIYEDCGVEFEEAVKSGEFEHVPVRVALLKKLFKFI